MAVYGSHHYTNFKNLNVRNGVLRFGDTLSSAMDDSNSKAIYTRGTSLYFWNGSVETAIGAAGSGGVTTFDSLYDLDKSLTIDSTTLTFDGTHATNDVFTITNATGTGDCLQITNSGSGKDVNGTSSTWSLTKAGILDCTGITIGDDETITFGDGSDATIQYDENGNDVLQFTGASKFDNAVEFAADVTLSDGSVTMTDADNAASLSLTNNTITSNTLIDITSTSLTSGKGLSITADAVTTGDMLYLDAGGDTLTGDGKYINCNDDNTSDFSVGPDGATTITGTTVSSVGLTVVGAQTSESMVKLTSSGVTASDKASLLLNPSGAIAAGGNVIRIAPSGTPVGGSYGIEFVGTGKGMAAAYLDSDATTSVVTVAGSGNMTADNAMLEVTNDGTHVAGSSLVYIHSASNAGGATAYGMEINCDGTNLEGLWVNAGAVLLDETLEVTGNTTLSGTLGVTGTSTFTGAVTCTAGLQCSAVQATATADGTGDGTIADGTSFADVSCDGANKIIILPSATVGNIVWLMDTDGNGFELRSSDPATIAINTGSAAAAESAITAGSLVRCVCSCSTNWVCNEFTNTGTESAVEAAAA